MKDLPFSAATKAWFSESFAAPTAAQLGAWEAIAEGNNALVVAPTGSGKTLAAFLWSIDKLATSSAPPEKERLRVLYVSPLKALAVDIEKNLRSPLVGIGNSAVRLGESAPSIRVAVRTGDTPSDERRRFPNHPPDILITTPESLFLLLTSQAREALRFVDTVILDEVHALAGTKRGSHLAISLERLDALLAQPARRIGLSATVRPLDEAARFLGGPHQVKVVNPSFTKSFDLSVVVPVEDMGDIGEPVEEFPIGDSAAADPKRRTIWPAIEDSVVQLIRQHRSTIVFANSRRLSERLSARINELAGEDIARAHHGSVSKEQRLVIEEELKSGRLPAVVATSSLELGIDMGAVDLVIQVEAPTSVASGLQRVGRAGHQVGAVSRGIIFPKYRGDLIEAAVVVERMGKGAIEQTRYPRNPLDVLAQQIVAMVAMDDWSVDDLEALIRKAAPFEGLPRAALDSVLDMLSGLYPSDEFAELRPRLNYDRTDGRLTPRSSAQRLAVTSGGTIPDRGLYGVFLVGESSTRVGELDEEMVYESRVGDVFSLGSSTWRIEDITHDRVLVSPAPGEPAKTPFWHGDMLGRPLELGRAYGAFLRELGELTPAKATKRLREAGLDELAASNLLQYLEEQKEATGILPDDRTIVVERFRDELGDWRICVHSPFGAQVHAPWALAVEARVRERLGLEVQTMHSDDGIVIRLPEADEAPPASSVAFEPDEIEQIVTAEVGGSALFAARFRECAARALLLPKRNPGKRTPLWQQRQKSANLLQVASGYGSFPIVLETMRECLQDVFDLPGLEQLMSDVRSRKVRLVEVETDRPSPFAGSLLFGYLGAFIYEGDAPIAERKAQALSLDTALLSELLGRAELRELLDADALDELELDLQMLSPNRRIQTIDDCHDALRSIGDLTTEELASRGADPAWPFVLENARRALRIRVAGEERWVAIEDSSRFRDCLGVPLPVGIPQAFLEGVRDPLGDLVGRFARTHGPFQAAQVAERLGLGVAVATETLVRLEKAGRAIRGEFRPGSVGIEWCDAEVLRALKRKSLARYRKEVEAVPAPVLARFLPAWQSVDAPLQRGLDGLWRAIEQLQGAPVPASALERLILPARVAGYAAPMLDELCAAGEVVWAGAGAIGSDDGWVCLYLAGDAPLLLSDPGTEELSPLADSVLRLLQVSGALFFRQISEGVSSTSDAELLNAIWDLVWMGHLTNDTLAPLRALSGVGKATRPVRPGRRMRGPSMPARQGPPAGIGRWGLLPARDIDPTRRAAAVAEQLLDRHGLVTRGAVMSESVLGGFSAVYQVLKRLEEAGRCRRGYFVEGLGASQFAVPGAVDRMRVIASSSDHASALVLAATDPANPFGAALGWPSKAHEDGQTNGHRPGRKAGAIVVIVRGELTIYVERGGRSMLTFTEDVDLLQPAVDALALAVREGSLGKLAVEKADGEMVMETPIARVLETAGFRATPKGLRLRA